MLSVGANARAAQNDNTVDPAWLAAYSRCVNFVDLVLFPRSSRSPRGELWAQTRLTLRLVTLLRAVAAAAPTLHALRGDRSPVLAEIKSDLSRDVDKLAASHAEEIAKRLLAGLRSREEALPPIYFPNTATNQHTYAFAATAIDAPSTPDEWVFTWGSVIGALARCRKERLLDDHTVTKLCPAQDLQAFRLTVCEPPADLDRRFQLFGLWSLSHLDTVTGGGPLRIDGDADVLPSTLRLEPAQVETLRARISETVTHLLRSEVSLVDSWAPYTTYMGPEPQPARDGVTQPFRESSRQEHRDDALVVPVVPVLLALVARYERRRLCQRALLNLIRASTDADYRRDRGRARPYQIGARDGVVNLSYWHEAYEALARTITGMTTGRLERVFGVLRATLIDTGRRNLLLVMLTAVGIVYALYQSKSTTSFAVGVIFAVLASVFAAAIAPPIVRYLYDDDR